MFRSDISTSLFIYVSFFNARPEYPKRRYYRNKKYVCTTLLNIAYVVLFCFNIIRNAFIFKLFSLATLVVNTELQYECLIYFDSV